MSHWVWILNNKTKKVDTFENAQIVGCLSRQNYLRISLNVYRAGTDQICFVLKARVWWLLAVVNLKISMYQFTWGTWSFWYTPQQTCEGEVCYLPAFLRLQAVVADSAYLITMNIKFTPAMNFNDKSKAKKPGLSALSAETDIDSFCLHHSNWIFRGLIFYIWRLLQIGIILTIQRVACHVEEPVMFCRS